MSKNREKSTYNKFSLLILDREGENGTLWKEISHKYLDTSIKYILQVFVLSQVFWHII